MVAVEERDSNTLRWEAASDVWVLRCSVAKKPRSFKLSDEFQKEILYGAVTH